MHVPALDGVFYIHKICDGAGGWLRGACTIVVDWERGCRCSVGSFSRDLPGLLRGCRFPGCPGPDLCSMMPWAERWVARCGGRCGRPSAGAGGSGDDGAGWGFGSFGLPLNLRHRRRTVSGPLRPVRTGHALLCHKNHLFPRMFPERDYTGLQFGQILWEKVDR